MNSQFFSLKNRMTAVDIDIAVIHKKSNKMNKKLMNYVFTTTVVFMVIVFMAVVMLGIKPIG